MFQFRLFGINTYIVYDPETRESAVIDPGMTVPEEEKAVDNFIESHDLKLKYIINTHLHIDHVAGNQYIKEKYGVPVLSHPDENVLGASISGQAKMFGLADDFKNVIVEEPVYPGETIKIGSGELKVISVAGHSPGGIALYSPTDGFVIVGDALFERSIGRTDLYGGDLNKLLENIRKGLFTLPDDTVVLSGHGPATTIGEEKRENPYLVN